jgi:hypothetical protein
MGLIERFLDRFGYISKDRMLSIVKTALDNAPIPKNVKTVNLTHSKEVAFKSMEKALDLTSKMEKALLIEMLPDLFSNALISVNINDTEKMATYTVTLKIVPASSW